ncbi:VOC family protein [Plantactinospora sonchi]|uniref:VOC family protein n=1 Tax=Plantactinospora sonchi TaxID=1544735 RepID=A0ABU7RQZ9_9ACTN
MTVLAFDHLVLVAEDVSTTLDWYHRVLGAEVRDLTAWRQGEADYPVLHFGTHKINVHGAGGDLVPRAAHARPGTLDLCFVWDADVDTARQHLLDHGQPVEFGPVDQEGARGTGRSVYTRDPDGNLIELICYPAAR